MSLLSSKFEAVWWRRPPGRYLRIARARLKAGATVAKAGDFMAAKIEVEKIDNLKFRVRIVEAGSETRHDVTVSTSDYKKFSGSKVEPEELVRRSFEFLLEREPKESILTRFDLSVIGRYFPEYEREIKRRLPGK